jgi:phenylacetate-coenzyme A ligase PaaK-like adenylate-forming protein
MTDRLAEIGGVGAEYLRTLWNRRRLRTREALARHQERLLARRLPAIARTVPHYAGLERAPLRDWPVMDKAGALAAFGRLNAAGMTAEEAWEAAERGLSLSNGSGSVRGLTVGTSTGTSGNRGLFLVSEAERRAWLGSILARGIPDVLWRRHRVALFLGTANELYDATDRNGRLRFSFHDLSGGIERHRAGVEAFDPTVLIAPPKALRAMAEDGFRIRPRHVFSGAEILDGSDRAVVERAFGTTAREIYQATEGFLGIACRLGRLHLNEDAVHFEMETVPDSPGLVVPVITDMRRGRCACGSPLQAVEAIVGRSDDVFELPARDGGRRRRVFPETLRTAVLDGHRGLGDFRVLQTGASEVEVRIADDAPEGAEEAVLGRMERCLASAGTVATVRVLRGIQVPYGRKLRRVERVWFPS